MNQLQFAFGVTPLVKHGHFYMNVGESLRCPAAAGFATCRAQEISLALRRTMKFEAFTESVYRF